MMDRKEPRMSFAIKYKLNGFPLSIVLEFKGIQCALVVLNLMLYAIAMPYDNRIMARRTFIDIR